MSKLEQNSARKAKQHTVYKNGEGKRVPGVTTILDVMSKPALLQWANKIGLEGIEMSKYVDDLADIGTLAHKIIECYLKKEDVDYSDYTANQKVLAENAVLKFFNWLEVNDFKFIASELQLVSEALQYGGTIDLYCLLNGKKTLIDLKTCKACYGEHFTQVAAYKNLLHENGYDVDDVRILRIGRDESEGFDDYSVPKLGLHFQRFVKCRELYEINKELNRKG
jgi:hypothetical protein